MLVSLFVFIFMLIGMDLFAYQIRYDLNGDPVKFNNNSEPLIPLKTSNSLRTNMDDVGSSLVTIFIIAVGDDWNSIMYSYYRALIEQSSSKAYVSLVFFVVMYILFNMLLLNLFLAILLETYGEGSEDAEEKLIMEKEEEEDIGVCYICFKMCLSRFMREKDEGEEDFGFGGGEENTKGKETKIGIEPEVCVVK